MSCMWLKFGAIKYTFLLLYHGSSCIPLIVYRLHQFIVGTGCILIYLIVMNIICSLCHALYMYNWTKPVNIRDIPWTAPASIFVYRVFLDCILSEKLAHSTLFPSSFVIHNNHISFMLISGQALLQFVLLIFFFSECRYAGAVFAHACLKGLNGAPDIVECSFVQSTVTELPFFASKVLI